MKAAGLAAAAVLGLCLAGCGSYAPWFGYTEFTPILESWDPATGRLDEVAVFGDRTIRPAAAYFKLGVYLRQYGFDAPPAMATAFDYEADPDRRDPSGLLCCRRSNGRTWFMELVKTADGFRLDERPAFPASGRGAVSRLATLRTAAGTHYLETTEAGTYLIERVIDADGAETAVYERPIPGERSIIEAGALIDPPGFALGFAVFDPATGRSSTEYRFWRPAGDPDPTDLRPPQAGDADGFPGIVRVYPDGRFVRDYGRTLRLHGADGAELAVLAYGPSGRIDRAPLASGAWLIVESDAGAEVDDWSEMNSNPNYGQRLRLVAADLSETSALELRGVPLFGAYEADGRFYLLTGRGVRTNFSVYSELSFFLM
jgi:hypothetical protein